jgi:phospholipid-binding lipoprotein MlaA
MTSARTFRSVFRVAAGFTVALGLSACAAPKAGEGVSDPLEPVNRAIFGFNEVADKAVIRPLAEGYTIVVPDPIRDNIRTFIHNLTLPLSIANNALQGDFDGMITNTGRLMTNAVLGLGIADVATAAGIGDDPEDFGQTLAVWGFDSGPYIVIPLLGSSNLRDAFGTAVDSVSDPVGLKMTRTMSLSRAGAGGIDTRSRYIKEIDELRRTSLDYYATMRSLSQQQRNAAIRDNRQPAQPEFPDYDKAPAAGK